MLQQFVLVFFEKISILSFGFMQILIFDSVKQGKLNRMKNCETYLYSLNFNDLKTYLYSFLFVVGNIVLPQLCHLIPNGGPMLLPIFFFTLIAAYKYGFVAGLITAVVSPLVNSMLFGMPETAMLPYVLLKSVLLAVAAAYVAHRFGKVTLPLLIVVVLFYQVVGTMVQCLAIGDMASMLPILYTAIPGMLIQVFVGYLIIKYLK